ncbi:hypothetical protein [Aquimarina intermedia]|uniref:Uncharacterized protein n=1 Tax=Aquimarina intermedia TaxID=350814 RepID=A0A5S5CFQ6_9FLAO|nr:hypothetical protein [Aquimarina intermedia]TYP77190.1 hypothetical protein BD809_101340 [Aquimarina intermedia]
MLLIKILVLSMIHIIPSSIEEEAMIALSHYPELRDTPIEFKFTDKVRKSTMQAQPTWGSFFRTKKNRKYIILMSRRFNIEGENFLITDVPSEVLIGWLGHELGHVMDYRERSSAGMLIFGFKYLFSQRHIQEVERTADTYAVRHGMGQYIIATKNFILEHTSLSDTYKNRIKRLYLSPEEIMQLIEEKTD